MLILTLIRVSPLWIPGLVGSSLVFVRITCGHMLCNTSNKTIALMGFPWDNNDIKDEPIPVSVRLLFSRQV